MKEFIPYEQALAIKELGFDEPCFGYYIETGEWIPASYSKQGTVYPSNSDLLPEWTASPTFSQAFRWFREKYSLHAEITWSPSYEYEPGEWADAIYEITITNVSYTKEWVAESPNMQRANGKQLTYEGAELACLDKLIELSKNKEQ